MGMNLVLRRKSLEASSNPIHRAGGTNGGAVVPSPWKVAEVDGMPCGGLVADNAGGGGGRQGLWGEDGSGTPMRVDPVIIGGTLLPGGGGFGGRYVLG